MKKSHIYHILSMKVTKVKSQNCEHVMSSRDSRYEFEIDDKIKVIAVLCEDKNSEFLGNLLVEEVIVDDVKIHGMEAQSYIEESFDIDDLISQLNQ